MLSWIPFCAQPLNTPSTTPLNTPFETLGSTKTRRNLEDYIALFSDNARAIFEEFEFGNTVIRLEKAGLLYKICQNFAKIDLHPDVVPDRVMSNIYEHLIRRFGAEVNGRSRGLHDAA